MCLMCYKLADLSLLIYQSMYTVLCKGILLKHNYNHAVGVLIMYNNVDILIFIYCISWIYL